MTSFRTVPIKEEETLKVDIILAALEDI